MLAMPMAMPRADRTARRRRVRRPTAPTRSRSAGSSRERHRATTRPSRSAMRRGSAAARSRSWVMIIDRRALGVELAQQRHDLRARARVEVAGRLVGEDDRRPGDDRAGDRHALALAAGELLRAVVQAVPEPDALERRRAARACAARPACRCRAGPWRRSPARSSRRSGRTAGTRSRSTSRAAPASSRSSRSATSAPATGRDRRRAIERAHHVQQRRLARARRADDADSSPSLDLEADAVERPHAARRTPW